VDLVSNKCKLTETKKACKMERTARKEVEDLLKQAQTEIMELHNTAIRLQLESKHVLNVNCV